MIQDKRAATVLERAIARGQSGAVEPSTVLWVLASGAVVVLNEGEPPGDGFPSAPMIVTREGRSFLAVFSHEDLVGVFAEGRRAVAVPAFELLRRVPDDAGLVVNPGSSLGLEVPADGLRAFTLTLLNTEIPALRPAGPRSTGGSTTSTGQNEDGS